MSKLAFVGTSSGGGGCPTIFLSERGTLVVQGSTVTDELALEQIRQHGNGIPAHESCVEIPAALLPFIDIDALARVAFADADRPDFVVDTAAVEQLRARLEACASERV